MLPVNLFSLRFLSAVSRVVGGVTADLQAESEGCCMPKTEPYSQFYQVVELAKGRISRTGTYQELVKMDITQC